jgi:hypothetical protein
MIVSDLACLKREMAGAATVRRILVNCSVLRACRLNSRPETEAAPDGSRSCGNQPAYISLINRRLAAPAFSLYCTWRLKGFWGRSLFLRAF